MDKYSDYSREDLINKIKELEHFITALKKEKDHEELLDFPWVGNLGNWCWNVQTDRLICNDQKILALNYTKDDIPEELGFEFFTSKLHPEDYDRVMDDMRQHLLCNTDAYEVEYRIKTKEGNWKWYYDIGKVTKRDKDNSAILVAGIVFDITRKKEMKLLIEEQNKKLLELVNFDHLTNILNRKSLYEKLEVELVLCKKNNSKLSVAMMDIDRFKKVNDTYGHIAGDLVIKQVSDIIQCNLSERDFVGRYGGEEFLIVFPESDIKKAFTTTEKIRKDIENSQFTDGIEITISGGLKEYNNESIEIFIDKSDKYLYKAKKNGRNRIIYE